MKIGMKVYIPYSYLYFFFDLIRFEEILFIAQNVMNKLKVSGHVSLIEPCQQLNN